MLGPQAPAVKECKPLTVTENLFRKSFGGPKELSQRQCFTMVIGHILNVCELFLAEAHQVAFPYGKRVPLIGCKIPSEGPKGLNVSSKYCYKFQPEGPNRVEY